MRLSRLYSNKPEVFGPVDFTPGLNVVLAEIRLPENKKRDTHNLGKTTLGRLLDFCLLAVHSQHFFLARHHERFEEFIFFLEIELLDGTFVTVRRGVAEASRISFKKHPRRRQDLTGLADEQWDHVSVPLERARQLLDGLLDLGALKPWSYRMGLGYLLRSQGDFGDVFQLSKFAAAQSEWKPYLAHVLGFKARLLEEHYRKEEELEEKQRAVQTLKAELGGAAEDLSKIEGMLLLKQKEAERKQGLLDAFDFGPQDREKTRQLVEEINEGIARLNTERYHLTQNRSKISAALEEEQILFDPAEAERLFKEAGVLFQGQIKRDFEQLIAFNRAITDERRTYLLEERKEIDAELKRINLELEELGRRRSETLSFLSDTDAFTKYKRLADELVVLKADITSLSRQREHLQRLQELRSLADERLRLQTLIEEDVEAQSSAPDSVFSHIRLFFNEIIEEVIDRKALLTVSPNKAGHLEFKEDILDQSGNATSAGLGRTYKKLLCIAFDMAVARAHAGERFPHFIFHDGIFESLDDRKKENLLAVIRRYTGYGIQQIVTLIDSDLPPPPAPGASIFEESEVVLRLHDEGESGRLFKMPSW